MRRSGHPGTFSSAAGPARPGPRTAPARPVTWRHSAPSGLKVRAAEHRPGGALRDAPAGWDAGPSPAPRVGIHAGKQAEPPGCLPRGPRTGRRAKPRLSTDNEIVAA
ncbi:translation initiation factor IF-2-like, partial [Cricetulus griseus]|uniref:Translation initiation factor IF-2-like n=1 Tax=Cricetulus griseus TaxID=10029 RepID=A0A9J7GVV0_CRIGR